MRKINSIVLVVVVFMFNKTVVVYTLIYTNPSLTIPMLYFQLIAPSWCASVACQIDEFLVFLFEFSGAMACFLVSSQAKMCTARPNELDMPPKHTKKRLVIYRV